MSSKPCKHCPHKQDEHTAKGGCMHRKDSGRICGCCWTAGPEHGANPFSAITTTTTKGK